MPALDSSKRQARGIFTSSSYVPWTCQHSIGILRQTCMILKQKLHLLILIPTWRKHVYMRDLRFVLRYCRKFQITEDRCLNWRMGNRFYGHMLKGQEPRKWKLVDAKLWPILFCFCFEREVTICSCLQWNLCSWNAPFQKDIVLVLILFFGIS